jgi:radical SAM superfamily enzyme YgiQ (UPF0313 family)
LNAINLLKEYNFHADIDFIFGLPGENEEDILINLQFFQDVLDGKYKNVLIHTHTFMPLPGTPFEHEPLGKIDKRIFNLMGKLSTKGLAFGEHQAQAKLVPTWYSKSLFK